MLKIGTKVKWHDPAIEDYDVEDREEVLNRVFEIIDAPDEIEEDSIILISDGFTEAEVYPGELEEI